MHLPFSKRRRMIGGLYFGPAGWQPMRWDRPSAPLAAVTLPRPAAAGGMVRCGQVLSPASSEETVDIVSPWAGVCDGREVVRGEREEPAFATQPQIKTLHDLINLLQRAGIGVTNPHIPPLLAQLRQLKDGRARTIIVNMLPQQPESMLPSALSYLCMPELVAGLMLLLRILPARRTFAALERHDRRTLRLWRASLKRTNVAQVRLLNRYPQANPTILARRLAARRLPVGAIPTRAGILMLDPVTLWAIGRFLVTGSPLVQRPIEIFCSDQAPRIVLSPLGASLQSLLASHGIATEGRQVIVNGIMSGTQADAPYDVVGPSTQMISIRPPPLHEMPTPCIACGWCVDHCPTELNPIRLHDLSLQKSPLKSDEAFEARHCIGCGLCSYVCPTRLPLSQQILSLRGLARAEIKRLTGEGDIYLPPPGEEA